MFVSRFEAAVASHQLGDATTYAAAVVDTVDDHWLLLPRSSRTSDDPYGKAQRAVLAICSRTAGVEVDTSQPWPHPLSAFVVDVDSTAHTLPVPIVRLFVELGVAALRRRGHDLSSRHDAEEVVALRKEVRALTHFSVVTLLRPWSKDSVAADAFDVIRLARCVRMWGCCVWSSVCQA